MLPDILKMDVLYVSAALFFRLSSLKKRIFSLTKYMYDSAAFSVNDKFYFLWLSFENQF